jgi:hypothetical protein
VLCSLDYIFADEQIVLRDLPYAGGSGFQPEKRCLPNTRTTVIAEIIEWIYSISESDSAQVCWVYGPAGAGKSSIAHTIAEYCKDKKLLGSMFCFSTSVQSRKLDLLFPTISRDLANFDPTWKRSLANAIQDNDALRTTASLEWQFKALLLDLATGLKECVVGPIVIVIDALDECGDGAERMELLGFIARLQELPSFFHFVVTSRSDKDMADRLKQLNNVFSKDIAAIATADTNADIQIMLETKLRAHITKDKRWIKGSMAEKLVDAAEQSFQWASTAYKFIQGDNEYQAFDWYERFQAVVPGDMSNLSGPTYQHLNKLYNTILEQFFPSDQPLERFKLIIGHVLAVEKPVSLVTLQGLCTKEYKPELVVTILRLLGSLLYGVFEENTPIYPLHSSFREFLTAKHSGKYSIDLTTCNNNLAYAALHIMNDSLRFNICHLETSYCLNKDYPSLDQKIQDYITPGLAYSVQYWATHLEKVEFSLNLLTQVEAILKEKALFWLETLSLLCIVNVAAPSLAVVNRWISKVSLLVYTE